MTTNKGGARAGAGRRSNDGLVITNRANVSMDRDTFMLLMELGDGNISAGVRNAAAQLIANGYDPRFVIGDAKPKIRTGGHASPNTTKPPAAVARRVVAPVSAGAAGGVKRALRYDDLADPQILSLAEKIRRGIA